MRKRGCSLSLTPISVLGVGNGGVDELRNCLGEESVYWALLRFQVGCGEFERIKFVALHFNSENLPALKRAKMNQRTQEALGRFGDVHATMEVHSLAEFGVELVCERLLPLFTEDTDIQSLKFEYEKATKETSQRKHEEKRLLTSIEKSGPKTTVDLALADVGRQLAPHNWVMLNPDLSLYNAGSGGFFEMQEWFDVTKVLFGCLRFSFGVEGGSSIVKHVFFHWVGTQVPVVLKGKLNAQKGLVEDKLREFVRISMSYEWHSKEDIDLEQILMKVGKISDTEAAAVGKMDTGMLSVEAYQAHLEHELEWNECEFVDYGPEFVPEITPAVAGVKRKDAVWNWVLLGLEKPDQNQPALYAHYNKLGGPGARVSITRVKSPLIPNRLSQEYEDPPAFNPALANPRPGQLVALRRQSFEVRNSAAIDTHFGKDVPPILDFPVTAEQADEADASLQEEKRKSDALAEVAMDAARAISTANYLRRVSQSRRSSLSGIRRSSVNSGLLAKRPSLLSVRYASSSSSPSSSFDSSSSKSEEGDLTIPTNLIDYRPSLEMQPRVSGSVQAGVMNTWSALKPQVMELPPGKLHVIDVPVGKPASSSASDFFVVDNGSKMYVWHKDKSLDFEQQIHSLTKATQATGELDTPLWAMLGGEDHQEPLQRIPAFKEAAHKSRTTRVPHLPSLSSFLEEPLAGARRQAQVALAGKQGHLCIRRGWIWRRRYCQLDLGRLRWWSTARDCERRHHAPVGAFSFADSPEQWEVRRLGGCLLEVSLPLSERHVFAADSPDTADEWSKALSGHLNTILGLTVWPFALRTQSGHVENYVTPL